MLIPVAGIGTKSRVELLTHTHSADTTTLIPIVHDNFVKFVFYCNKTCDSYSVSAY